MIAVKYIFFAIISTAFNLLFQYLSLKGYDDYLSSYYIDFLSPHSNEHLGLYGAMFCGTVAGLIVKYVLDKKYIFYDKSESKKEDSKKFILYSIMGLFTTAIFWATELIFDHYSDHTYAKYVGAVVGLSIGYVIKYFLDKKFVFKVKA